MPNTLKIILKSGKDDAVKRFHPWVFSGAIKKMHGPVYDGCHAEVFSNKDEYLGCGIYQDATIAVRIMAFAPNRPGQFDGAFWKEKLLNAYRLRKSLGLTNNNQTNVYRLVHGEGDHLPGLIIDHYDGNLVIQIHATGLYGYIDLIAQGLKEIYGDSLKSIYDKSAETLPASFWAEKKPKGFMYGQEDCLVEVAENDHRFMVDICTGQKTGFFIDQRDNRRLLATYAHGRKVLNTFCYTGGFSAYALQAGAAQVHSVDSSSRAIELTDKNVQLNFGDDDHQRSLDQSQSTVPQESPTQSQSVSHPQSPNQHLAPTIEQSSTHQDSTAHQQLLTRHQSFTADTMDFLRQNRSVYDLIILDPPAYAKHQHVKHNAVQGYKRLNLEALKTIADGGILFTFSCSQVIDMQLFRSTVMAAAILAGRQVRILHQLSQPADHPVNIFHPEGQYLKGLVLMC